MNFKLSALLPLALLATVSAAHADTLGVFSTGMSSTGTTLAQGAADSHYTLVNSGSAITMTPNPNWAADSSKSQWIGPVQDGTANEPATTYDYRTTFTITGSEIASTAQLAGLWTSDNQATIYLNGVSTGLTTGNTSYNALQAFSITSGFVSGVNTLDFMVVNSLTATGFTAPAGPTGLDVQIAGTVATAATPEPSSLIMLGTGIVGAAGMVRRRFNS